MSSRTASSSTSSSTRTIALDFTVIDRLNIGAGHYRYTINLVRGLQELSEADARFLLIGSHPEPVKELRELFAQPDCKWRYVQLEPRQYRGEEYIRHLRYAWLLRREKVDLLHIIHAYIPIGAPCPLVVTKHDLMEEVFPEYEEWRRSRPYRLQRWALCRFARRIICISENTARDLAEKWGVHPDRIAVIRHGLEQSFFEPVSLAELPPHDFLRRPERETILVAPYNLEPRKNLGALLEAVALLQKDHPRLKLVLFGSAMKTPDRERAFEDHARRLGIEHAIYRVGLVSDQALRALYRQATLFIFPSLYEGFGLPVLEAMAVGACVVARNGSAMAEVVGEAGILVETGQPEQLAEGIRRGIGDTGLRETLKQQATERARTFTLEKMVKATYQSYLEALA